MKEQDVEMMYWFSVHEVADLLGHADVPLETFLNDVYLGLCKTSANDANVLKLLAVLEYLKGVREIETANDIAKELNDDC
jgi:hypothetical protein